MIFVFTPTEIESAFRRLFGLLSPEIQEGLRYSFKEEIEGISLELLAWKYAKSAFQPLSFCEAKHSGKPVEWYGKPVLNQRAAFVAADRYTNQVSKNFRATENIELWLLEDMTFATVLSTEVIPTEDENRSGGIACRYFLNFVEERDDLSVCEETLIYALDDTCTFAQVELDAKTEMQD